MILLTLIYLTCLLVILFGLFTLPNGLALIVIGLFVALQAWLIKDGYETHLKLKRLEK